LLVETHVGDILWSESADSHRLGPASSPPYSKFTLFNPPNSDKDGGIQCENECVQRGIRIGRSEEVKKDGNKGKGKKREGVAGQVIKVEVDRRRLLL
jgi:hypothetical protein